ncbi:hypothetical protein BJ944DRAFT_268105 [Cunninghamella echinulata]|nr:hypothetical protein BJ944DRAFT_268105 [Cunninghamella echinulata]
MTRSTNHTVNSKNERHVARNGLSDIRSPIKKAGAGHGNWGTYVDLEEFAEEDMKDQQVFRENSNKLQLVDEETFQSLRQSEQNVS